MSEDIQRIARRRAELAASLQKHRDAIAEEEAELAELETAERVILRLSGKVEAPDHAEEVRTVRKPASPKKSGATRTGAGKGLSMPQMIEGVLRDAYRQGHKGLAPKQVAEKVREKFSVEARGDFVGSIVWRMWKRDQIQRVAEGLYALPPTNEATDQLSLGDGSAASESTNQQPREAGAGGGT